MNNDSQIGGSTLASSQADGLVDRIYEAAFLPQQWIPVLEELSRLADGNGGMLFASSGPHTRFIASDELASGMAEYIAQGWPARTDRPQRLFAARHAGFLGDLDVYTREEMDREPVFVEFLRPKGFGWGTATAIEVPTGQAIVLNVERRYSRGPVERHIIRRLDKLRPHLARAASLSAQLSLERMKTAALTLDLVGLPATMLDGQGRALAVNAGFSRLMPGLARQRLRRLELVNTRADALFAEALQRIAPAGDGASVRSIPIAADETQPATIVHLIPLRRSAHDLFTGAHSILVATRVAPKEVPTADVLQGLFDLTPAEARVARSVAERHTIDAIAASFGLSRETVRTQIKAALAKTGVNRNIDLAVLLSGAAFSRQTNVDK